MGVLVEGKQKHEDLLRQKVESQNVTIEEMTKTVQDMDSQLKSKNKLSSTITRRDMKVECTHYKRKVYFLALEILLSLSYVSNTVRFISVMLKSQVS